MRIQINSIQIVSIAMLLSGCKAYEINVPQGQSPVIKENAPEICEAPKISKLEGSPADKGVLLNWTYEKPSVVLTDVFVERRNKDSEEFSVLKKLDNESQPTFSDLTAVPGNSYSYRVRVLRALSSGETCAEVSNVFTISLKLPTPPAPPAPPTTPTTQPIVILPPPPPVIPDPVPAPMVAGAPAIHFVDIESGPLTGGPGNLGAPISIFGAGFGAKAATSKVLIGGVEVSSYLVWAPAGTMGGAHNTTLDLIVVQPPRNISQGNIQVIVNGKTSAMPGPSFRVNQGKILYIAKNGSDAAVCSETAPCTTISSTIGKLAAGDLILMRGGDYPESEIWLRREYNHSGTVEQRKAIKAYPGENVYLSNGQRALIVDADYLTISGLRFLNGKSTGVSEKESLANSRVGNKFINNSFEGTISWSAIDSHGNDHVLAGNACKVSGSVVGTQGHCYYISYGNNIKLLYNIGSGAPGYGIHIFDQRRRASGDFQRVLSNILVEGNILTNSTLRSGLIIACGDEGNLGNRVENVIVRNNILAGNAHLGMAIPPYCLVRNIKVYNNTFYENGRQAISFGGTNLNQDIDVANNLFYQTENKVCKQDCTWYKTAHVSLEKPGMNVTFRNNGYAGLPATIMGTTDAMMKAGMAMFASAMNLDLRLLPGSLGLNQGISLPQATLDFFGVSRTLDAAPDLGAFEK
ncbi:MAG: hypothetical protein K2X47_04820 [Bdellovibrionales bacterium]|nr:hypothetical protein [Bdellovibrionales bacterium]